MNRDSKSDREELDEIEFARKQRRLANEVSQSVWQMVRNRRCCNQKFRREYPVPPYTADFCCVALKLVIEVDGKHHHTTAGKQLDQNRDRFFRKLGYTVLRIPGFQVTQNPQQVRNTIVETINILVSAPAPSPPAPLPRKRRRGEPK